MAVRRPCDHAVLVPAVQGVREHEGVSDSVHRQSVGQVRKVLTCAEFGRLHRCSAWERLLTHLLWCNDRCWMVQTVLVDNGSGMFMAGFDGYTHLSLCSLRLSAGLRCQASWLVLWKWPRSSSTTAVAGSWLFLLVRSITPCSLRLLAGLRWQAS